MNAYKLYLIIVGTRRFSYAAGFTLFAIYLLRVVETNPMGLILPGVVYETANFLFEIPTGIVADVYSRRLSVILGYLFMGLGFVIAGLYPVLLLAVLGLAVAGIGSTFVSGALSAWLVDEVGQERASQAFLRGAQINTLAQLAGIGLSVLLGTFNLQVVIIGAGIPMVGLAVVLHFVMPETGFKPEVVVDRRLKRGMFSTFGQGLIFVRQSRIFLYIFIIIVVFAGFGESFGKLWQAHILENYTLPALATFDDLIWFGIVSSVSIPVSLLATEAIRRRRDLEDGTAVIRLLLILFVCLSFGGLLFALSGSFMMTLVGIWLVHSLKAMIRPLLEIWLNQQIESHLRATVLSIVGQVNALGEVVLGGLVAGSIATAFGLRIGLVIIAFSLLILIPIFRLTSSRHYKAQGLSEQLS